MWKIRSCAIHKWLPIIFALRLIFQYQTDDNFKMKKRKHRKNIAYANKKEKININNNNENIAPIAK